MGDRNRANGLFASANALVRSALLEGNTTVIRSECYIPDSMRFSGLT